MRLIPAQGFPNWAAERKIELDARYPKSGSFTYLSMPNTWWQLDMPAETMRLLALISDALDALGSWKECLVWHRKGVWPDYAGLEDPAAGLYSFLLAGAGIRLGFDGAIACDCSERKKLIAVAAAPILFGRTICEDVLLFPDHGKFFLECDHHQDMTVSVCQPALMESYEQYMRDRGHEVAED